MKRRTMRINGPSSATNKVADSVDKVWHDTIDLQKYFVDASTEELPMSISERLDVLDIIQDINQYLFIAKRKLAKLQELMLGY